MLSMSVLFSLIMICNTGQIQLVGSYNTPGWSRDVYVRDGYAYVADYDGGFRIIDISTPSNPTEVGFCFMPGQPFGVYVKDDYAYISCHNPNNFCIVDISTPSAPILKSYVQIPGHGNNVFVLGNFAYLAVGGYSGGLYIYDVSDPLNPQLASSYLTYSAIGVYVTEPYALLAAGYLYSFDVSNPNNPILLDNFYISYDEYAYDVCIDGDYAYCVFDYFVLDYLNNDFENKFNQETDYFGDINNHNIEKDAALGGLRIFDISNPSNLINIGNVYTSQDAFGVCVHDDYVYSAGWVNDGIQAINATDPTSPFIIESYNTPGEARDLFFYNNLLFLADGQSGLEIYEVPMNDTVSPVIDSTTIWSDTLFAGPFTVNTKVTDNIGLNDVLLYYKRIEDPNFHSISMTDIGSNWFSADIPQAYIDDDTIKYYIFADDINTNQTTDPVGAPANYYYFIARTTGVEEVPSLNPTEFSLSYIIKSEKNIHFYLSIPERTNINFKIYDLTGRIISELLNGEIAPGQYEFNFIPESRGTFFYLIEIPGYSKSEKFIVL